MSYEVLLARPECPRCHTHRVVHFTSLFKTRGKPPLTIEDHWDEMRMKRYVRESRNRLCAACDLRWFFAGQDESLLVQQFAISDLVRQMYGRGVRLQFEAIQ